MRITYSFMVLLLIRLIKFIISEPLDVYLPNELQHFSCKDSLIPCLCMIQQNQALALCNSNPTLDCGTVSAKGIYVKKPVKSSLVSNGSTYAAILTSNGIADGNGVVFIVGEQKCGTTLLDTLLTSGKSTVISTTKLELHMFDHFASPNTCQFASYVAKLNKVKYSMIPSVGKLKFVGDPTPDYLNSPLAAIHISTMFPLSKIIILVRHPIHRFHAAWDQNRRLGGEKRVFSAAVSGEFEQEAAFGCRKTSQLCAAEILNWNTDSIPLSCESYWRNCVLYYHGFKDCWMNQKYNLPSPIPKQSTYAGCKRYLIKGYFDTHISLWLNLVDARNVLVVQAEALFGSELMTKEWVANFVAYGCEKSINNNIEISQSKALNGVCVIRKLDRTDLYNSSPSSQYKPTASCWHDCEVVKSDIKNALTVGSQGYNLLTKAYGPTLKWMRDTMGIDYSFD